MSNTIDNLCIHIQIEVRQEKGWSGEKPILARAVIEDICTQDRIDELEGAMRSAAADAVERAAKQLRKTVEIKQLEEQRRVLIEKGDG